MTVIYPAIFHAEDGTYWAEFPDLLGCQTYGQDIPETLNNAKEALSAYCLTLLEMGEKLPVSSPIPTLSVDENSFATLVETKLVDKARAVKKTLTLPAWLNELAESQHINFSAVLQEALETKLAVKQ